jgi:phosphoglycolate phosphatase-like HAD superfamily hydrolase
MSGKSHIALFDTDKTLIEMTPLVNKALDETLQEHFGIHGDLNDLSPDEYAGQHMSYIISRLVTKKTDYEGWYIDSHVEEAMKTYVSSLTDRLASHGQPRRLLCPGTIDFLEALKKHKIPRGVFSGGISEVHKKALEVTGLGEYFNTACTSDRKGAADRVQLINFCVNDMKSLVSGGKIVTGNIAVFGDAPNDIRSANKYRAKSIAILARSLYSREQLQAERPFKIYESFTDYERILRDVFEVKGNL